MATPSFWENQFSINTTKQGRQIAPDLQALKNGTFLAVWEDMSRAGADRSSTAIHGQLFNADGTKKGGEFLVNTTTFGIQTGAQVVELNDGRFVVVWSDEGGGNVIRARHYNADGTAIGADFKVNTSPARGTTDFAVSALSDGGYAVAFWTVDNEVVVKSYTAALQDKEEIVVAAGSGGTLYGSFDIAAQEGHYTVFFMENSTNDLVLRGRIIDNDGTVPGASVDIVTPKADTDYHSNASTTLTNGLTAIAWTEDFNDFENESTTTIKVRLLTSNGARHGEEIVVASSPDDSLEKPTITHLADGGFAIAYYRDVPGEPVSSDLRDIYLATFDGSGARLGSDLQVARAHAGVAVKSLTTLEDGRVVVSWTHDQGETGDVREEIRAQIIDPRQKAINLDGTSRDDQYIGTGFHDTLNGGAGADTLAGAEGNDTYYVDNLQDQVKEIAGQGMDTVIASGSYRLDPLAEVELLKLNSASSQTAYTLEGSSFANAIKGHAGANTLMGHDGNDKLSGDLGNDRLYGGIGQDIFVFDTRLNKRTNVDKIADFRVRDDSIWLDNKVFTKLGSGTESKPKKFKADMFVKSTKAQDAEDRIIYDKKTGSLYYDADGTGSRAQVKIATLSKNLKLTHSDFFVI